MSDLPAPLTPPNCDLRGYDFMPLFGQKLFASRLYTRSLRQPRAGMAALKLWWCAWQQCPAGSLPDDDEDLSILADFGTDMKAWKAAREIALHGFVKCSDGRLYHPVLCEEAKEAYERRVRERERKAEMRAKKKGRPKPHEPETDGTDNGSLEDVPRDNLGTGEGPAAPVRVDRDRDRDRDNILPSVVEVGAQTAPSPPKEPRGHRLPEDREPDLGLRAFATGKGFTAAQTREIAQNFHDYWRAESGVKATKRDWRAAFRLWVSREKPRPPERHGGGELPIDRMTPQEKRLAVWAHVPDVEGV